MKLQNHSTKKITQKEDALYDQHPLPTITISHQKSLLEFLQTSPKTESVILIDVKTTQEGCVFGAEVNVEILKNVSERVPISETIEVPEIPDKLFYISKEFLRFFGNYTNLKLELKGKFRKKIICTNIPPFITKTCGCNSE